MLFLGDLIISKEEYISLKAERDELKRQIRHLEGSLKSTESRFRFLSAIYDPTIHITEVNNKSMGHRYIGRFTVPGLNPSEKSVRLTVSIGKVSDFMSIEDPKLIQLARQKAVELIERRGEYYFLK